MHTESLMFALLRIALGVQSPEGFPKEEITQPVLEEVYNLSKKHDLTHIAGQGLAKLGLLGKDEISEKFRKQTMQAVQRYMRMQNELLRLAASFEKAQIPFIPLKGAVIRDSYPESWMRISGDIDFFVQEKDLQTIHTILTETLQYKYCGQWGMEITYLSPSGVHIEVHYDVLEEVDNAAAMAVLKTVWDRVQPAPGWKFLMRMTDEFFYFHHIAHMAKHFVGGGCGIRPVMDIWVLNNCISFNTQQRNALLQAGGLLTFAQGMESLSNVWFLQAPADEQSQQVSHYLLDGGVYGTITNLVKIQQGKKGGRFRYILSRIFVPYRIMKNNYPILQKHKYLLPVMEVWRWIRAIFTGNISRQEMQSSMQSDSNDAMGALLQSLGLKE